MIFSIKNHIFIRLIEFITTTFLSPADEFTTTSKLLKQRRFLYETKLTEIHEFNNIISEILGLEAQTIEKKEEINYHDRRMYKKFNYKIYNQMQKILFVNKDYNENDKRKSDFSSQASSSRSIHATNENQTFNLSNFRSPRVRQSITSSTKHLKFNSLRPKSASLYRHHTSASNEVDFTKNHIDPQEKAKNSDDEQSTEIHEKTTLNDLNLLRKKQKVYSMQDAFWNRVLTNDLKDNSEISNFLFDSRNMVSLKNFMELSKQGQSKNPKIYFNHKIYREFNDDYKPKVLTTRKCCFFLLIFYFNYSIFVKISKKKRKKKKKQMK